MEALFSAIRFCLPVAREQGFRFFWTQDLRGIPARTVRALPNLLMRMVE
jgi:hypothetical protein